MINYTIHNLKTNLNRTNLAARSLMSSIKTAKSSNYLTITIPTASRINRYWVTTDLALIRSAHTRMLSPTERKKTPENLPQACFGKKVFIRAKHINTNMDIYEKDDIYQISFIFTY